MQRGAPEASAGCSGGDACQTGSAHGPILFHSDVDTNGDNGEYVDKPDGSLTVGLAGAGLARFGGRPSRFAGRERPKWTSASTRGPVRGTAGRERRSGMVGRILRVNKGPLGSTVEVGGSPPLRPPPPPAPHGIRLATVEWPHWQGSHLPKGVAPTGAGPGGRKRRKACGRVPYGLLQGASQPRLRGGRGRW